MYYFTVHISITPSGTNTAGEYYQLTCTFISSTATPTFSWLGPPNGGPLLNGVDDTRLVSDVMSSGSTHTSILQFNPLQSSHEGNYICQVTTAGSNMYTSAFQVNEDSVPMATTQPTSTRPGDGNSGDIAGGVSIGAVAGGFIVVLLVVGVAILLAAIFLIYWRHRYVCTLLLMF